MAWTALKAYNKIKAKGVLGVAKEYPDKSYNKTTGVTTLGAVTDHDVYFLAPYIMSSSSLKEFGNIDGVKESEKWTMASHYGLTFDFQPGMNLVINGDTWIIKAIKKHVEGTDSIASELGLATR